MPPLTPVAQRTDTGILRIQLLDPDDLSLDPPSESGVRRGQQEGAEAVNSRMTIRWRQYVQSYVLNYQTEGQRIGAGRKTFLSKCVGPSTSFLLVEALYSSSIIILPPFTLLLSLMAVHSGYNCVRGY